ncbi:unnamed protein product [Blepharisma stoltei]|uniref:Uncharacterized protein n=1 Tax=Blepharisma stoltei TaxID=1481888 RepID=A0AAU9KDF6_9CILI|nr:unnamed protein product [Blepharisma stoltei]
MGFGKKEKHWYFSAGCIKKTVFVGYECTSYRWWLKVIMNLSYLKGFFLNCFTKYIDDILLKNFYFLFYKYHANYFLKSSMRAF